MASLSSERPVSVDTSVSLKTNDLLCVVCWHCWMRFVDGVNAQVSQPRAAILHTIVKEGGESVGNMQSVIARNLHRRVFPVGLFAHTRTHRTGYKCRKVLICVHAVLYSGVLRLFLFIALTMPETPRGSELFG